MNVLKALMTVNLQQLARTLKEVSPAYVEMAGGLIAQVTCVCVCVCVCVCLCTEVSVCV